MPTHYKLDKAHQPNFDEWYDENYYDDAQRALNTLYKTRDKILDLYYDRPFEDGWSRQTEELYGELCVKFEDALEAFKEHAAQYKQDHQNEPELLKSFEAFYKDVIEEDCVTYKVIALRHQMFPKFKLKRKRIIAQLNDQILKRVKDSKTKDYSTNLLAKAIQKYDSIGLGDLNGITKDKSALSKEATELANAANADTIGGEAPFTSEEAKQVFKIYVFYRKAALYIFDGLSSPLEDNTYPKEKETEFIRYCNCDRLTIQMLKQFNIDYNDDDYIHSLYDRWYGIYRDRWNHNLYESLSHFDPFTDDYDSSKYFKDDFKKMSMIPSDANKCNIWCNGADVFAGTRFLPGDIIEICPCRKITAVSVRDKEITDLVFEIIPGRVYAIPFGYAQYYGISENPEFGNCDYVYDPNTCAIIVKAHKRIEPNEKLIFIGRQN